MNPDREALIRNLFQALRHEGLCLGLAELLAALRADRDGYAVSPKGIDDLTGLLTLLWCKSEADRWRLDRAIESAQTQEGVFPAHEPKSRETPRTGEDINKGTLHAPQNKAQPLNTDTSEPFGVIPTQAPPVGSGEEQPPPYYHYPLSRRDMRYAWRYLRRMIADGPCDVLDVLATVECVAQQGFFLAPVLRRHERNHAHLVLLLDHLGSMVPFHHYLRELVETALNESDLGRVDIYYYYNVPCNALYTDALLQKTQTPLPKLLASLSETSAVMIVSDAGAARHHHDLDRILATLEFLYHLRAATSHIAWLNPMPSGRWLDSSAEVLARHTPMFPMDREGLSHAVDSLRGLNVNVHGRRSGR